MSINENDQEILKNRIRKKEYGEQTIELAEQEIDRLCTNLNLSESVSQVGSAIYRKSLENKFIENRTIGMLAAGSVYTASRVENDIRPVKKIASLAVGPETEVSKKALVQRIFSEISNSLGLNTGPVDPEEHLERIISNSRVRSEYEEKTKEISKAMIEELDGVFRSGRSPIAIAASAVYVTARFRVDGIKTGVYFGQATIARTAGISSTSISNTYQDIIDVLKSSETFEWSIDKSNAYYFNNQTQPDVNVNVDQDGNNSDD